MNSAKQAFRYCIVDQVVLDVRILTELIWILRSNCLNSQLGLSSSSKEDEYTEEKELKIQISSGKTSAPRGPRGLIDDHEYGGGGDAESQPTRAQDPNQFRHAKLSFSPFWRINRRIEVTNVGGRRGAIYRFSA